MSNCRSSSTQEQALADILAQDTAIFDRLQQLIQVVQAGGNSGVINGLTYPLVDGAAGDVITTDGAGNLTLQPASASASAKQFPLRNAVYVDNDAATLAAQGILAYTTLELAMTSWRPGGAAQVAYGTPTADNPGLILIGAGTFPVVGDGTTGLNCDVNFIKFIGQGPKATKLTLSAAQALTFFDLLGGDIDFVNLSVDDLGNSGRFIFWLNGALSVANQFSNLEVLQTAILDAPFIFAGGAIPPDVTVKDCSLTFTGTGQDGAIVGLGNGTSLFERCAFNTTGLNRCIYFNGSNSNSFNDCTFSGDATIGCIVIDGGTFSGRYTNCTFTNTVGKGISVFNTGSFTGLIDNCEIVSADICFEKPDAGSRILDSSLRATGVDINAITDLQAGAIIQGCRIIGTGTGVAIDGGVVTVEITGGALRMPTGDVPGSSVSATLILSPAFASAFNAELLSATTV